MVGTVLQTEHIEMQRSALVLSAFASMSSAVFSPAAADEPTKIPADVKKHMKSMVGSWTFEGHQGDRTFKGEETVRVVSGGTALLQRGFFQLTDGGKEHYVILSGWDGDEKTVHVRGFTSHGISWSGEWKTVANGVWTGTASGGRATFEVKADTMRYEDAGEGTPWVSEFTRKSESEQK